MEEVRVFSKHWVTDNQKNKIKMKHNFPWKKTANKQKIWLSYSFDNNLLQF